MAAPAADAAQGPADAGSPELVPPAERPALLAWLDDGLRDGRRGRLAAEYPTALGRPEGCRAFAIRTPDGGFAAHALARCAELVLGRERLRLGMIGSVYTDPAWRGRGLGSRVVEACARDLRDAGAPLAALWSDRHGFYARLGFRPAGREHLYSLDGRSLAAARGRHPADFALAEPCAGDWPELEALHARRPVRVERAPGELARLAAAPGCRVVAARGRAGIEAYAALGRGDDFAGVVHEWAGAPEAMLACLEALAQEARRDGHPSLGLLAGPQDEPPLPRLRRAGAALRPGCFALLRVLDADALWRRFGGAGSPPPDPVLLAQLFDPAASRQGVRRAGDSAPLPVPLFVWGFDSV